MGIWSVYLIRTRQDALYTGITMDVERRFFEHQHNPKKGAKALRGKGPLSLVFNHPLADKSTALKVEMAIKKLPKSDKESLISSPVFFVRWLESMGYKIDL